MSNTEDNNLSEEITQVTNAFNLLNIIDCQKSADKNDPDGIFWLGYCYEHGIGVEKNKDKAFINYQKSAEMNNSNGIYKVGYCYHLGIGVEIDKYKAFMYFLRSAEAGYYMGMFKTAICYLYGFGVEQSSDKYKEWINKDPYTHYHDSPYSDDDDSDDDSDDDDFTNLYYRDSKLGKCAHCKKYNTREAWCVTCDPDIEIQGWTSGNKDIDNCIKEFQLRTHDYENMVEWIPYNRLKGLKKIGEGGFGSVFSATWLDGIRKITTRHGMQKIIRGKYIRAREPSSTVALKTLSGSVNNPKDFIKEFDNHMRCTIWNSKLKLYGLTQNTETNECMIVFQYANKGSLSNFLRKNFHNLTWETKLKLLKDIAGDLRGIHTAGYIHADFHSGNILQNKGNKGINSYITDLGLSKKYNENNSEDGIFGVMPYVAPEVLLGQKLTKAADIYGFGVIMSEMSTGQRPYDGREFNLNLSIKICKGLRPEFAPSTPNFYIEFAKQCMDADPQKRPTVQEVYEKIDGWNKVIEYSDEWNKTMNSSDSDKEHLDYASEIKKQFFDADKIAKELSIVTPKHSDFTYTSKFINTKKISDAIEALPSQPIDSPEVPVL